MSIYLAESNVQEDIMMRDMYCRTLIELAEEDERIVALDADLMKSMGMIPFLKAYPERTFNCGVQEANMIGVAAGLSATGKIPYVHSFGTFSTRRCYDQIYMSAAYAKLNVRIIGSDPGITAAYNGGTHMPLEDLGIMRLIPDLTIIEPVDSVMLQDIIKQLANLYGVFYVRLLRRNAVKVYESGSTFKIDKAVTLKEGNDLTIIASGIMVVEALKAAKLLSTRGISARVVNNFTLKPIDKETICRCALETGAIVTVENHNIVGGLGSAVAEVLAENTPVPLERVGVCDLFGEVGPVEYLMENFNMTAASIVERAKIVLGKK
ncbi:MAG: transketolase family protein [Bacillota bacterium]|nr:transketolase family protein [Bacillota bacterium]